VGWTCGTHGRGTCSRFWWESQKETDHLKDKGVDGRMGSEWILGRLAWGVWIGFDWLRTGTGAGCCECGDEPSDSGATDLVGCLVSLLEMCDVVSYCFHVVAKPNADNFLNFSLINTLFYYSVDVGRRNVAQYVGGNQNQCRRNYCDGRTCEVFAQYMSPCTVCETC
jgi:hypothetical protein